MTTPDKPKRRTIKTIHHARRLAADAVRLAERAPDLSSSERIALMLRGAQVLGTLMRDTELDEKLARIIEKRGLFMLEATDEEMVAEMEKRDAARNEEENARRQRPGRETPTPDASLYRR